MPKFGDLGAFIPFCFSDAGLSKFRDERAHLEIHNYQYVVVRSCVVRKVALDDLLRISDPALRSG